MKYWLMKAPSGSHTLDELAENGSTLWTGVRSTKARDLMTRRMQPSDRVLYFQSGPDVEGIAGLMRVSAQARPDPTQFDKTDANWDSLATYEKPIWYCVAVELLARASHVVTLDELRAEPNLATMELLSPASSPTVQPVEAGHFRIIVKLAGMRQRK